MNRHGSRRTTRPCAARAKRTRSPSGMKRVVRCASSPPGICRSSRAFRAASCAKASTTSFSFCRRWPLGAGVDAAMAGIDHDQRPRIVVARLRGGSLRIVARRARLRSASAMVRRKLSRSVGDEIEHQPRRLAVGGGEREGLVDPHRALGVEHDARAALHDQAVAERLDQAAAVLAGFGRQLEGRPAAGRSRPDRDRRA